MIKTCPYMLSTFFSTPIEEDEQKGQLVVTALGNILEGKPFEDKDDPYQIVSGLQMIIRCREEKCGKYNSCHNIQGESVHE